MSGYYMTKSGAAVYRADVLDDEEEKRFRPVVVIDPEDRAQVERLAKGLPISWNLFQPDDPELGEETVTAMQAALRSLIAPPRPPEPQGLGAVVEDSRGKLWIRHDHHATNVWTPSDNPSAWFKWDEMSPVRVLSEGVS